MYHPKHGLVIIMLLTPLIFFNLSSFASAAHVHLEWEPSTSIVEGYRLYWGTSSRNYSFSEDVGLSTNTSLYDLCEDTTYYIAITAYLENIESNYSNEVIIRGGVPISESDGDSPSSERAGCNISPDTTISFEWAFLFLLLFIIRKKSNLYHKRFH
jgi:hypothetical protein